MKERIEAAQVQLLRAAYMWQYTKHTADIIRYHSACEELDSAVTNLRELIKEAGYLK